MYDIYIKNYVNSSGTLMTSEKKLYSVPITNSQNALTDPCVKMEMGKAGSFEFSIMPTHPYYDSFLQMKTLMRVVYDGTTIFRGRVLMIDNTPFTGERKIHLEGDLAFLMDTIQPGVDEDDREEVEILKYLKELIRVHNEQIRDDGTYVVKASSGSSSKSKGEKIPIDASAEDKKIVLGDVPGQYSSDIKGVQKIKITESEKKKYGSTSWESTSNALDSLADGYGGFFRTRYVGSTCYLDWLDFCFRFEINDQPIKVKENLIDISASTEVDNLFTALIPIGSDSDGEDLYIDGYKEDVHGDNKRILVPQIVSLYKESDLNHGYHRKEDYQNAVKDYGIIYKTQNFSNADTQEKLWKYAVDWIKDNYVGGITSFTISAMDMHHLDSNEVKYLVGDRVKVVYPDMGSHTDGSTPTISRTLTIVSAEYYPHNPEKNQFNIGVPNLLINREYGSSSSSSSSSSSGSSSGSSNTPDDDDIKMDYIRKTVKKTNKLAKKYVVNNRNNNDVYMQIYNDKKKEYGEEKASQIASNALNGTVFAVQTGLSAAEYSSNPDTSAMATRKKKQVQSMVMDGVKGTITMNGPVDHSNDLTDEQVDALNSSNRSMVFNSVKQEYGIYQAMDTVTGGGLSNPQQFVKDRASRGPSLKLSVGDSASTSDSDSETQGKIELFDSSALTNSKANALTSLYGDGTHNGVTLNLGASDSSKNPGDNPTVKLTGPDGSGGFGDKGDLNGWKVTLNKEVSYTWTDANGKTHNSTLNKGTVGMSDLHFTKSYDSLKAELAVVDVLLADYAKINTLEALSATIDEIHSKYITADAINATSVTAALAKATFVNVNNLSVANSISCTGPISGKRLSSNGHAMNVYDITLSNDGNSITISRLSGGSIVFNKGDTDAAYNQGWNDCVDAAVAAGAVYTRTNIYNNTVVGGNAYAHYYDNKGVKENIGTGWYLTSYAPRTKK